jgi:hypothetical protein
VSVFNGQVANATTFNNAFLSRLSNSDTVGIVGLLNVNPVSGSSISNVQRELNSLGSFLGQSPNQIFNSLPSWTNTDVGSSGDNVKARAEALTLAFNSLSGHNHDGTLGSGAPISALSLTSFNQNFADFQTDVFASAAGLSDDVTSVFTSLTPNGGPSSIGVPTTAPYNKVELRTDPNGDEIEEPGGKKVYGRITESSGTWTLTYFYEDSGGIETAYSLPSQDIRIYWREVFDAATRPTFGTTNGFIGSFDATADVIDATQTLSGKVNTTAQTFGGIKTFANGAIMSEALSLERLNIASGGVITAMANTNSFVKFTGTSTTEVQGIAQPTSAVFLILYNASTGALTLKNQDAGAPANNRIITSDGNDVVLSENQSVQVIYDSNTARWRVCSGVGTGGGGLASQESLGTGDGVTTSFGPLSLVPSNEDSIAVYINGLIQDTADWSLSGSDIVFSTAPSASSSVYVFYLTDGTPTPMVPSATPNLEYRTLTGGEATAESLTLAATPLSASMVKVDAIGGGAQEYAVDFTVSGTTLSWAGLGLSGVLSAGDKLRIDYLS